MKNPTFAQRIKEATLDAAAQRHRNAVRTESLAHPEVKRTYDAIPAAYKRQPKWDYNAQKYNTAPARIYIDVASYSNMVTIGITLNGLKDLKKDKRLTNLLAVYMSDGWDAKPTTDNTWSEEHRGRTFEFVREVPVTTKETHPSVKWLRKQGRTWDLDAHMNSPLKIRVVISAYVKEDNETCRIEVTEVREEVVRTEVKRLVCA